MQSWSIWIHIQGEKVRSVHLQFVSVCRAPALSTWRAFMGCGEPLLYLMLKEGSKHPDQWTLFYSRAKSCTVSPSFRGVLVWNWCTCWWFWQMASPGNWMHLQYQSRLQARKALSKDGKVFGDAIMVGVKPCIDKVSIGFCPPTCLSACLSTSHFCHLIGHPHQETLGPVWRLE